MKKKETDLLNSDVITSSGMNMVDPFQEDPEIYGDADFLGDYTLNPKLSPIQNIQITKSSIVERWKNESADSDRSPILPLPKKKNVSPITAPRSRVPKSYYSKYLALKPKVSLKLRDRKPRENEPQLNTNSNNPRTVRYMDPVAVPPNISSKSTNPLKKIISGPEIDAPKEDDVVIADLLKASGLRRTRSEDVNMQSGPGPAAPGENRIQMEVMPLTESAQSTGEKKEAPGTQLGNKEDGILSRINKVVSESENNYANNSPGGKFVIQNEEQQYKIEYADSSSKPTQVKMNGLDENGKSSKRSDGDKSQDSSDARTAIGGNSSQNSNRKYGDQGGSSNSTRATKPPSLLLADVTTGYESPLSPLAHLTSEENERRPIMVRSPVMPFDSIKNGDNLKVETQVKGDDDIENLVDNMMIMARKNLRISETPLAKSVKPPRDRKGRNLLRQASFTTSVIRSEIGKAFDYAVSQFYSEKKGTANKGTSEHLKAGGNTTGDKGIPQTEISSYSFSKWIPSIADDPNNNGAPQMKGVIVDHAPPGSKGTNPNGYDSKKSRNYSGNKFIDNICAPDERLHFYLFVVGIIFVPAAIAGAIIKGNNVWRKRCIISSIISITVLLIIVILVVTLKDSSTL